MGTIQLINMNYTYNAYYKPVFKNVNLQVDTDWKLGLIGRNGRGKTTLLNLIHGSLEVDKGNIHKQIETEIFPYDYLKKHSNTLELIKDNIGPYFELENEMQHMLDKGTDKACIRYSELISIYNDLDGYEVEAKIKKEFNLMNLPQELLHREFNTLSGGEKTKALIIALFLRKNHFLLLDEPTNHLDIDGRKTLADYLSRKKGFIVVSHDRNFLDVTVDHILSINKCTIEIEKGNFSSWNSNRLMKESYEIRKKERIETEVKAMEMAAKESRIFSHNKEKEKKGASDKGFVGARAARLMKRAKNIERRKAEQLEEKKLLLKNFENNPQLVINQNDSSTKQLINIQDLSFGFENRELFDGLSLVVEKGDRIWIRGANGTGKSTLLNIIRGRIKNYSGIVKIHPGTTIAESHQEALWRKGYLNDKLRNSIIKQSVFRCMLSYFNIHEEYFDRPLETYSQGELKKIDIARALSLENQIIILDEPLNYMDLYFREQLERALFHYKPTLIFVEHDKHFGEKLATNIVTLGQEMQK
jgi:lincosamide and streptogramin A transport system ATP-binding/permease protein